MFGFEDFFQGGAPGGFPGQGGSQEPVDTDEYYETLEVEKNASNREIKKAWRKLCKTHHPDRGGDPEVFKKIEAAYEVLSDPEKRELYDQGGKEAVQNGGMTTNIFDMFGGPGRRSRNTGPKKPAPVKKTISIELEEVFSAPEKSIEITIMTADERNVCSRCNGRGMYMETIRRGHMILQSQVQCRECDGEGISFVNERKVTKTLDIYVPAGVKDGNKLVLDGEGHDLPDMATGDVIVEFRVKSHPVFQRIQADLAMQKELTIQEAICGFEFLVKSIDEDEWLKVVSPEGHVTQPDEVVVIKGKGLPQKNNRSHRGDLYIRFSVILPESNTINEETAQRLCELLDPRAIRYVITNKGAVANDNRDIEPGDRVRLIGLKNKPDLNGVEGVVMPASLRPGQYAVRLETGRTVGVKREFLQLKEDLEVDPELAASPSPDAFVDIVTGETVDPEGIEHTPAATGHAQYDEDDDEEHGPACRQM